MEIKEILEKMYMTLDSEEWKKLHEEYLKIKQKQE
jgi:hypothetical protein